MNRKILCPIIGLFGLLMSCTANADVFNLEDVAQKAQILSQKPYQEQVLNLPKELADMDYDAFRSLRYVREEGPWYKKNIPFELQFFHMGSIFKNSVKVHQIVAGETLYIPYTPKSFTLSDKPMKNIQGEIDYAGFRLHYPLNTPDYYDELISFLGASYFRALGKNQKYGLSARGLAINTGVQTGEEFPIFKEFWIKRPAQRQRNMTIYALLDSPSVSGAYEFFIQPGKNTRIDVTAILFPRADIQKLGVAPLTSMYLFGENTKNKFFDYRPEVHDSDGLLVHNGNDEWLWRPLDNARQLRMSSFSDKAPKGFGLFQRDRNADHYQDLEAYYQDRPSVWIEPLSGFGTGRVHLVEIPSDKEIHDNIVAFWLPDEEIKKGKQYTFKYRMNWMSEETEEMFPKGKIIATRTGIGGVSGVPEDDYIKYVLDFKGGILSDITDIEQIKADVSADSGEIKNIVVQKNIQDGGHRLFFDFKPPMKTAELRAVLKSNREADKNTDLTEVWSYQYLP
ncbi:MAG: glucan biosynthesis protein [Alphaproteobacteria bacterium]|nr:glucan biosynthesis protein [Alphaproteobacteria bacterium]